MPLRGVKGKRRGGYMKGGAGQGRAEIQCTTRKMRLANMPSLCCRKHFNGVRVPTEFLVSSEGPCMASGHGSSRTAVPCHMHEAVATHPYPHSVSASLASAIIALPGQPIVNLNFSRDEGLLSPFRWSSDEVSLSAGHELGAYR